MKIHLCSDDIIKRIHQLELHTFHFPALDEMLRLPDLNVDVGISVVKLLLDHNR